MSGSGTCPRRVRGTRHPLHGLGHPPGLRRLRPARISRRRRRSISSGHTRPTGGRSSTPTIPATCRARPTLEHFLRRYGQFIRNCAGALKPGGKLAILMGDYSDREAGFVPLVYHTKRLAFAAGLTQHCTDIIRFSHGASSGKKVYRSSFIPGLHDVCMIFEKQS